MKIIHSFISLILLLIILSSSSCQRKEKVFIPIDKDFLSYINFNTGSYWIYKEINSGELDTVKVISNTGIQLIIDHDYYDKKKDVFFENVAYTLKGKKFEIDLGVRPYGDINNKDKLLYIESSYFVINGIIGYAHGYNFFRYENGLDTLKYIGGDNDENTYIASRSDSMLIQNKKYYSCITYDHDVFLDGNILKTLTYSKGVGIIKRIMWDGTEWEIIDYHLN